MDDEERALRQQSLEWERLYNEPTLHPWTDEEDSDYKQAKQAARRCRRNVTPMRVSHTADVYVTHVSHNAVVHVTDMSRVAVVNVSNVAYVLCMPS